MQQLPLHRAAAVGSAPMVGLFLQEDRDARGKYPIDGTDRNGYTALHHGEFSVFSSSFLVFLV